MIEPPSHQERQEIQEKAIPCQPQYSIIIAYKARSVGESRLDFVVGECLIVEMKAVETLLPIHQAQVLSYLKVTRLQPGILNSFNEYMLKQGIRRVVLS